MDLKSYPYSDFSKIDMVCVAIFVSGFCFLLRGVGVCVKFFIPACALVH